MTKTIGLYLLLIGSFIMWGDHIMEFISKVPEDKARIQLTVLDSLEVQKAIVKIYNQQGKIVYNNKNTFTGEYIDLSPMKGKILISDVKTGQIKKSIPIVLNPGSKLNITTDLRPEIDATNTPFRKIFFKLFAYQSLFNQIILVIVSMLAYFFLVLVPLSLLAMILSLTMEWTHGVWRQFVGSWYNLLMGLGWLYVGYHFGYVQQILGDDSLAIRTLGYILIVSYPLYFFADRNFNKSERALMRAIDNEETWAGADNYTYTETTWSDGSKTDDKFESAMGAFIGTVLIFLCKPLLLPLFTSYRLYTNYLLPLFEGEYYWRIGKYNLVDSYNDYNNDEQTEYESIEGPILNINQVVWAQNQDGYFYPARIENIDDTGITVKYPNSAIETIGSNYVYHIPEDPTGVFVEYYNEELNTFIRGMVGENFGETYTIIDDNDKELKINFWNLRIPEDQPLFELVPENER